MSSNSLHLVHLLFYCIQKDADLRLLEMYETWNFLYMQKSLWFLPVKIKETKKETKQKILSFIRSSRNEVFCKKGVLRNLTKFTGKHLFQSLFFNKIAGLRSEALLEKILAQVFSCEFCKISINAFSYRTPTAAAFVS